MDTSKQPSAVIVHDSPSQLKFLSTTLVQAGITVQCFESAELALHAMHDQAPPDLVVTDLHMPDIDGWRFSRLLRSPEYAALNAVPVMVVSAKYSGTDIELATRDLGADAFVPMPAPREAIRTQAEELIRRAEPGALGRVLVVEDDELLCEVLARQFTSRRYAASTAFSTDQARALIAEREFDLAIVDHHLPDGRGDELVRALKGSHPTTAVIVITGDPSPELAVACVRQGADAYVRKPFEFEYLLGLCEKTQRERCLLYAEELLGRRTRQLREQEELYGRLVQTSPDAIVVTDLEGTVTFCNQVAAELHGSGSADELLGRTVYDLIAPEDHQRAKQSARKILGTGGVHNVEFTLLRRDGTRFVGELSASLLNDADGQPNSFVVVVRDISERRRAEQAREQSLSLLRATLDSTADGILVVDRRGSIVTYNERFAEQWRIPKPILDSRNDAEALAFVLDQLAEPEVFLAKVRELYSQPAATSFDVLEFKDGRIFERRSQPQRLGDETVGRVWSFQDVTERRRAEEQFRDQLTALHRVSNELSGETSVDDLCRRAVALGREHLGYERLGIWFADDDPQFIRGAFGIDEHGRLRDEREQRVRLVDDSVLEYFRALETRRRLVHDRPLRDAEGNVVGHGDQAYAALWDGETVLGFVVADNLLSGQPIGERQAELLALYASTLGHLCSRKRADEAMRKSEETHRLLAENITDVIWTTDMELRYTYFSPSVERMRGYTPEEAMAQTLAQAMTPDSYRTVTEALQAELALEREGRADPFRSRTLEIELNCKEGTPLWTEVTVTFLRDEGGVPCGLLGVTRDISARKRAEQALALESQRLATTLRNMDEAVVVADDAGKVILTNDAAVRLTGWTQGESLGKELDDLAEVLGAAAGAELLRPEPHGGSFELVREGPPEQIFELRTNPIAGGPEAGGWVLLVREVTAQRHAQQQIAQQGRLAAVGQLAAGIAHDFNNLLTGIVGFAELLCLRDDVTPAVKDRLQVIRQQGQRAAQLIRQILDFSRRSIIELRPLNLVSLLKETCKMLERTIEEHVRLRLDFEPIDYMINADVTQIQQLLTNLAVNARDAMAPRGGDLTIGLGHADLGPDSPRPFPGMPNGRYVVLSVADTGDGMPPEVLERCFEPFFTTKGVGQGTGLGLAQVYGIVKQHRGYIDVASEIGEGTTFTIHLPAVDAPEAEDAPLPAPVKGDRQTILLVEDEDHVLGVLQEMLTDLDYVVLTARNGRQALEVYARRAEEIALVLTDMTMPELGGVELFHALKARDPEVKVVVISGYPVREESDDLLEQGLAGWIQKPPTLRALADMLSVCLSE